MFQFRLQRILDLRLKHEHAVAGRLAEARGAEEQALEEAAALERLRDAGAERAAAEQNNGPTIGQLRALHLLVERMSEEVRHARDEADAAREEVAQRMDEFTIAFRERRVLDRLREKELEGWKAQEASADRQAMDSIALGRFVRKPKEG
jgi:flagellar FliJ protein